MTKNLFQLACMVLTVLVAAAAHGQDKDWYIAPMAVYTDDDGDRNIDDSVAGGQLSIGRAVSEHVSLEGALGYSDLNGFPGQKHLDVSFNMLAFPNRDRAFAPYFLAGIGYLGTELEGAGDENRASGTLGLGFRWALGASAVSIRGEYRARLAYESDNNLTDFIGSLGLQFSFGGGTPVRKTAPKFDGDGDGVMDHWDRCPGTRQGVAVDDNGCPRDSDGDGVVDGIDACPDTPAGVPVNSVGCPPDSDRDGVPDDRDKCPNTVAGAEVDADGCERDDDRDGVVNRLDECPNSPAGIQVDIRGCEIGDVIELSGVNFENNSDRIMPGSQQVLRNAAATLRKNPDIVVEVAGHTDSVGSAASNASLSERRAKSVRDFLVGAGVNPGNLTAKGYGETRPVADNTSALGRAVNRRVELIILNR